MTGLYKWGDGKMQQHSLEAMQVYPSGNHPSVNRESFLFVCGPGDIVNPNSESGEDILSPQWGLLGLYPYLVRSGIPFFNGHLPPSGVAEWMPTVYQMMQGALGAALIFYDLPWPSYFETALFMWFLGQGSGALYLVVQSSLECRRFNGCEVTDANLPGPPFLVMGFQERQHEVNGIVRAAIANYCRCVKDKGGRVRPNIGPTGGENGLVNMLQGKQHTGILQDSIGRLQASLDERYEWGDTMFVGAQTDIAWYLRLIYLVSLGQAGKQLGDERQRLGLDVAIGQARSTLHGFFAHSSQATDHWRRMEPVATLLNLMLPMAARARTH
jgi:hypothetical protein